jgi:SAM-dependent methyltransferase
VTAQNPKVAAGGESAPAALPDVLDAAWRDFFARMGETPAHPEAQDFLHRDLKEAFARIIPADASVFEAGCAEGDLLASLPNTRRMGIDYLPDAIARAQARHPEIGFEVGDITAAAPPRIGSAAAGTWDAVICDRLAHSVLDVKALLLGLKRHLAPGGRIYMTAFNYMWELPTRLAEMTGWKRPAPTSNWLSDSDYQNLFDIAGLEVVRYEDRVMCRSTGSMCSAIAAGRRRRGGPASASSFLRATRRATSPPRWRARPSWAAAPG